MQPLSGANRSCAGTEAKLLHHLLEKEIAGWVLLQWALLPLDMSDPEGQWWAWLEGVGSCSGGDGA